MRFIRARHPFGADRRDLGLVKAGYAIATAMGWKGEPEALLPIEPPAQEQTLEEAFAEMQAFSKSHNLKFNGNDNRNPSREAGP